MTAHHGGESAGDQAGALASVRAGDATPALRLLADGETVLSVSGGAVHAVVGRRQESQRFIARLTGADRAPVADVVLVDGREVRPSSRAGAAAAGIALVAGGQAVSWTQTVGENVLLGNERPPRLLDTVATWLGRRPVPGTHLSDSARASRALALVGLDRAPAEPASGLSSVERRLLELARAVAAEATVVVIDDTGAGPGEPGVERWRAAIRAVAATARPTAGAPAVLLVTGRVVGLSALATGATVLAGPASSVRLVDEASAAPTPVDERAVLARLALTLGDVDDAAGASPSPSSVSLASVAPTPHSDGGFEVESWSASHPADAGLTVVDRVSFTCAPGEVLGLFGPPDSGAGEVLLSLFGRSYGARVSGTARVDGAVVDLSTTDRARAAGVLYTTEHPIRFDLSFLGGVPSSVSPESLTRMVSNGIADARRDYRATTVPNGIVAALPGAHRGPSAAQFTESLQLLAGTDTRVLLLAEPFGDPRADGAASRRALVRALAATGRAVVVASEDPAALAAVCDRVLAVRDGGIVGETSIATRPGVVRTTTSDVLQAMGGLA